MDTVQGVLEASPDAVLVVDTGGVIRRANRNVRAVLGYESRELEGKTVEDLLVAEDRDRHVEFRREYMASPEPRPMGSELDLYALREDGTTVPVEISLGPIEQDGDLYVVATVADISRRKRREAELKRKNERLEEFASIVSHDLRNPLNVAEGHVQLAMADFDIDHLDAVARAHDRMDALIEDLLTLARAGETADEFEPVDLTTTVEQCWDTVDTADATLVAGTDRTIRAGRGRLRQLLENLIRNAIDHGGENVTVTLGDLDDGFYVEDTGPGIPETEREDVFDAGYTTATDGTGFGLSIAKQVADTHGWEIRAAGGTGGGARFEITGVALAE